MWSSWPEYIFSIKDVCTLKNVDGQCFTMSCSTGLNLCPAIAEHNPNLVVAGSKEPTPLIYMFTCQCPEHGIEIRISPKHLYLSANCKFPQDYDQGLKQIFKLVIKKRLTLKNYQGATPNTPVYHFLYELTKQYGCEEPRFSNLPLWQQRWLTHEENLILTFLVIGDNFSILKRFTFLQLEKLKKSTPYIIPFLIHNYGWDLNKCQPDEIFLILENSELAIKLSDENWSLEKTLERLKNPPVEPNQTSRITTFVSSLFSLLKKGFDKRLAKWGWR